MDCLSKKEREGLAYDWEFWARENQTEPSGTWWDTWLILAGRGYGKTRTAAEIVRARVESGRAGRIALIAETAADARDVVVEGESGILSTAPRSFRPLYEPSKRRITWPNGAIATTFSGEDPEQLRGPQFDFALCDELGKYRYAQATWDMLQFALRLGESPQTVIATTPRPIPILKELVQSARSEKNPDGTVALTHGSTYENKANLSPQFVRRVLNRYEGTRLGRQELNAELLGDTPGALWTRELIEQCRVATAPELIAIIVGVDPQAGGPLEEGDEMDTKLAFGRATGIVAGGIGANGHGYVLEDATVSEMPAGWGSQVVTTFSKLKANKVVGEVNNGGKMVGFVVATAAKVAKIAVPFQEVHASRGKFTRAEPISALYEQQKIHHVGAFPLLEDELCTWVPGQPSPNRLDALVWTMTKLMLAVKAENDIPGSTTGRSMGRGVSTRSLPGNRFRR